MWTTLVMVGATGVWWVEDVRLQSFGSWFICSFHMSVDKKLKISYLGQINLSRPDTLIPPATSADQDT